MFKDKKADKLKKRVGIAIIILISGLILGSLYFFVFYPKPCPDSDCFSKAIENCRASSLFIEDETASWIYTIKGNAKGDACKVKVELKEIKQGTIDSEKLQGKQMYCIQEKTSIQFPGKDISKCSGILKEELQDLIIQRMHNYLLENVGEIKEEFQGV